MRSSARTRARAGRLRLRAFLPLLLVALYPATAWGEGGPDVRGLIDQVDEAFAGRGTVTARFHQDAEMVLMGETRRYDGRVWYRHPDRLRLEYEEPAGQLLVSDGTDFWMLLTDQGRPQVFRAPVAGEVAGLLSGRSLEHLAERCDARLDDKETVGGVSCHRIVFDPIPGGPPVRFRDLVVRVGVRDLYTRRLSYEDAAGNHISYTFEEWRAASEAPAGLFTFTPPPGADLFDDSLRPIPAPGAD